MRPRLTISFQRHQQRLETARIANAEREKLWAAAMTAKAEHENSLSNVVQSQKIQFTDVVAEAMEANRTEAKADLELLAASIRVNTSSQNSPVRPPRVYAAQEHVAAPHKPKAAMTYASNGDARVASVRPRAFEFASNRPRTRTTRIINETEEELEDTIDESEIENSYSEADVTEVEVVRKRAEPVAAR